MRLIDADAVLNLFGIEDEDLYAKGVIEDALYDGSLPTIEPERNKGEWVDDEFVGKYRCSECDYYAVDEYDYCPNCGADMREKE